MQSAVEDGVVRSVRVSACYLAAGFGGRSAGCTCWMLLSSSVLLLLFDACLMLARTVPVLWRLLRLPQWLQLLLLMPIRQT